MNKQDIKFAKQYTKAMIKGTEFRILLQSKSDGEFAGFYYNKSKVIIINGLEAYTKKYVLSNFWHMLIVYNTILNYNVDIEQFEN